MDQDSVIELLANMRGFRGGVFAAEDFGVVDEHISIPLTVTAAAGEVVITGESGTALTGPGAWVGDRNLAQFMPNSGRFVLLGESYQFRCEPSPTLDPAENAALCKLMRSLRIVHEPKVRGAKERYYPAAPGWVFDSHVMALDAGSAAMTDGGDTPAQAATEAVASVQTPYPAFTGRKVFTTNGALAFDVFNDIFKVKWDASSGIPTGTTVWLDLPDWVAFPYGNKDAKRFLTGADAALASAHDRAQAKHNMARRLAGK